MQTFPLIFGLIVWSCTTFLRNTAVSSPEYEYWTFDPYSESKGKTVFVSYQWVTALLGEAMKFLNRNLI
jgi:hypothetical protein